MTLGRHLAYTGAASAALLPFRSGEEVLLFAAAGILIDADHYLVYVMRRRDASIRGMFQYFAEFQAVEKTVPYFGICLFHTADVLLLVGFLAWFFPLLRPVVAGMLFHHLLDIIDLWRKGVPFIRAFFLVEHFYPAARQGVPVLLTERELTGEGMMDLVTIAELLARDVGRLAFSSPVAHVYNPLVYARDPHERYLTRYGTGRKEAVFVGMNPGPWGMAQTGVPFGEVEMVRGWLGIHGAVGKPAAEHPRKRVEGFSCRRSEVSGRRLWGLFRARFGEPERFFARFFVLNYCPLLYLDADGRNITPDSLNRGELKPLLAACDEALRRSVACLGPARVVGIGAFAAARAETALAGLGIQTGRILHPSPASPAANRNWEETALTQLREQGIEL